MTDHITDMALANMLEHGWTPQQVRQLIADYRALRDARPVTTTLEERCVSGERTGGDLLTAEERAVVEHWRSASYLPCELAIVDRLAPRPTPVDPVRALIERWRSGSQVNWDSTDYADQLEEALDG